MKLTSNIINWSLTLVVVGLIALISNWIGQDIMPSKAVPGILALMGIALIGMILQQLIPLNIPSIAYIGVLGLVLTIPGMPTAPYIVSWTQCRINGFSYTSCGICWYFNRQFLD